mgnify:CR=1 FL=1
MLSCKKEPVTEHGFFMADSYFTVKVYEKCRENLLSELEAYLEKYAFEIDRHAPASLTGRLNETGSVQAPEWYTDLIARVLDIEKQAPGFNMLSGRLCDIWGFTDRNYRVPAKEELEKVVGRGNITLKENELRISDCIVDLGGCGKGFLLELAGKYLEERGVKTYLLNFGGNVMGRGERNFKIGIQDPDSAAGEYGKIITIRNKCVATSGDYERYFEMNGRRYCHIFDPATGYPAAFYRAVTVICDEPLMSDILSTSAFISGISAVKKNFPDIEMIGIKAKKRSE